MRTRQGNRMEDRSVEGRGGAKGERRKEVIGEEMRIEDRVMLGRKGFKKRRTVKSV